ncbi:MAG TPA: glucose-6-phosphate isomerase [Porphyromonadaceae bacterium]|nr:glucose-6-phosphate isomerase [Porphyromonadaceae bacterium]
MSIQLTIKHLAGIVSEEDILRQSAQASECNQALYNGSREGNDFIGWVGLPSSITEEQLRDIEDTAVELRTRCQAVVVVGIGGSYLGARAVIDALSSSLDWLSAKREHPVILYAGNNISEDYLSELTEYLKDKEFGIINISKSGTTTEPAIAFRLLKAQLEKQVGREEAKNRIVAITDVAKGALRSLAVTEGYKTFVIPDDVGGRYSVLTPVGLLPIAVAGINIRELVKGAVEIEQATQPSVSFEYNLPAIYAVIRNELYKRGKKIEILVNYHPKLHFFAEWWKQLFGESEGKEGKGIFPASLNFTTDLHSMGQFVQEGRGIIFETNLVVEINEDDIEVPFDLNDFDKLNYISGKTLNYINAKAFEGTFMAHNEGNVPGIIIRVPKMDEFYLAKLFYFFMMSCGISGYTNKIDPFTQPGVEAYKRNMFKLLGER